MNRLHQHPQGANATDPPSRRLPWKPSKPGRWSMLGLDDPEPDAGVPTKGLTADVLAWAMILPGADDPVSGIVEGVAIQLFSLANLMEANSGDVLLMLARQLQAASLLLARTDNRVRMPVEEEPESDTMAAPPSPPAAPSPPPSEPEADSEEDLEKTRDAAPEEPAGG